MGSRYLDAHAPLDVSFLRKPKFASCLASAPNGQGWAESGWAAFRKKTAVGPELARCAAVLSYVFRILPENLAIYG
jgi:hypothetical protein